MEGITVWVPSSHADVTIWRAIRSGCIISGIKMGLKIAKYSINVLGPLEEDRKAQMKERTYIYLMIIGVATEFQGQGFGSKLIGSLVKESEQTGIPIYLETTTERNVRMYERFGFKKVNQTNLPVINLSQWEMVRKLKK